MRRSTRISSLHFCQRTLDFGGQLLWLPFVARQDGANATVAAYHHGAQIVVPLRPGLDHHDAEGVGQGLQLRRITGGESPLRGIGGVPRRSGPRSTLNRSPARAMNQVMAPRRLTHPIGLARWRKAMPTRIKSKTIPAMATRALFGSQLLIADPIHACVAFPANHLRRVQRKMFCVQSSWLWARSVPFSSARGFSR